MWDKPAVMNAVATMLFVAGAALALSTIVSRLAQLPEFALREIRIDNPLIRVTRDQIEDVARREVRGNFFTVNLAVTRAAFERLPWVRRASVRRHWPARLEVALEEHTPFARWGATSLVNTHGEVFQAAYGGELPVFNGPPDTAREIAIQYRYFLRTLAAIGEIPVELQVTERRAWRIRLESGLTLALGRENIEGRLNRFVAAHGRTLAALGRRVDYVDLRYANGFAARIPGLPGEKAKPRSGGRG